MDPNIVILAGGISSRMKAEDPAAKRVNPVLHGQAERGVKSMLGVGPGGRPFLDYLLRNSLEAGYRDVVVVTGEADPAIRERYGGGRGDALFPGLRIGFAVQPIPAGRTRPLGTADALERALRSRPDWREGRCTVCNSDNLYSVRALRLLLEDRHAGAMIDYDRSALQFPAETIARFAVILKDAEGYLRTIVEKPAVEELGRAADAAGRVGVSMNIFRFTCRTILPVLEELPLHPVRDERELPAAVQELVRRDPRAIFTIPLAEQVIDLTRRGDIPVVQEYLRRNFRDFPSAESL